jgi:hypothetical protein
VRFWLTLLMVAGLALAARAFADFPVLQPVYSQVFVVDGITVLSDRLVLKAPRAMTLRQFDCVAYSGITLTSVDITISECSASGTGCATTGAVATMTVTDTNVTDSSFTDAAIASGSWLQYATGGVTWVTPGNVTCELQYAYDS